MNGKWASYLRGLYKGRLGRRDWAIGVILSFALWLVSAVVVISIASVLNSKISLLLLVIVWIVYVYFIFSFLVRRLHDLNQPGWKSLLFIVPIVNIAACIWLLVAKGTDKDNRYGSPSSSNFLKALLDLDWWETNTGTQL